MDYEKAYKEALEGAKRIKSKILSSHLSTESCKAVSEYINEIIPELAESENERIIRELIEHIESNVGHNPGLDRKEGRWIAWLEKQKEQKSVDEKSVDEVGKSVRKKWAIDFIRFLDEHRYDGKMCVSNGECMDIENAFISADWEKLIRYYNKYTQKPAEWSEEDEEKLNQIDSLLWLLDDYVGDDCSLGQEKTDSIRSEIQNVLSPWLKSLRPQPKQEWSDTDRKNIERLIKILPQCIFRHPPILERDECRDLGVWLKALLDCPKKSGGWKPSEEQMLKDAFVDNDVVHDGRIELEGDPLPSLDPILLLPYPQFEPGDKVRIIVVKEEE